MSTSVLITGGAGFIGCALARRLVTAGYEVAVMDALHPQVHAFGRPAGLPASVLLLTGDVTHAPDWEAVLRLVRPEQVVHLAAETGTGQSLSEATRHGSVNVVGTTQLLDALTRAGLVPHQLVLASSRAVYGEGAWRSGRTSFSPGPRTHAQLAAGLWDPRGADGGAAVPLPSSSRRTEAHPTSIYAATKLAQEHMLLAWAAAHGSALSVLRLQNVYGPGQSLTNPYTGIVSLFARLARARRPLEVYEDGRIVRDFVFIEDVVDALAAAVESLRRSHASSTLAPASQPPSMTSPADWLPSATPPSRPWSLSSATGTCAQPVVTSSRRRRNCPGTRVGSSTAACQRCSSGSTAGPRRRSETTAKPERLEPTVPPQFEKVTCTPEIGPTSL